MPRYFWLADACTAAGLRTVEVQGWRSRGDYTFNPRGVVIHHTAGSARGDMPSIPVLVSGRSGLPGPLAQFGVARSGTVYVIAAGLANHAGAGGWNGLTGNGSVWGIEAENTGTGAEAWPAVQLDAMHRLSAVLATKTPFGTGMVCGHKEWAPTRKVDPRGIDMDAFRRKVADLTAPAPNPQLLPDTEDAMFLAWDPNAAWLVYPADTPCGLMRRLVNGAGEAKAWEAAKQGGKVIVAPVFLSAIPVAA